MHSLLSRGLIVARRRHGGGAGLCSRHGLIVHFSGHFLFVEQRLVAAKIVLRLHIICLGNFQLCMRSGDLIFGVGDCGARVLHAGRGEIQLARGIHRSNRNIDVQRLSGCFPRSRDWPWPLRRRPRSLSDRSRRALIWIKHSRILMM